MISKVKQKHEHLLSKDQIFDWWQTCLMISFLLLPFFVLLTS